MNEADFQRLLDASAAETRKQIDDLRTHVDDSARETRKHVDETAAEMRKHVDETTADTRKHVDETAADTRTQFEVMAADLRHQFVIHTEYLDDKFQLVVETVTHLSAKIDHVEATLRDEMQREFADTRAMIKFSHAELDRRVTSLETRVERLEGSAP